MDKVTRRSFVTTVSAATVVPAAALLSANARGAQAPGAAAPAKSPHVAEPSKTLYLFFNAEEALFIEAACERLIPADESGPGALGAGVPNYLDKQLGGAWGAGERLYRSGPWQAGTPSQGYQLPFTPAELFHASLRAINRDLASHGTPFHEMAADAQDAYLKSLESGAHDLDGVPSAIFFDMLLKMTVEGFFSDPVYGGNRDMVAWRMIGFPGAYADYFEAIDKHGVKFEREPMSLAEAAPSTDKAQAAAEVAPCAACHGAHGEGMAAAHVPRLAGQAADYLQKQLDNYADGSRDNPIMANFAKALSEPQRASLAARYAAMSAPYLAEAAPIGTVAFARGHKLAYQGDETKRVQACNGCHGPDGVGVPRAAPYLAGQSAEYLASALKAFQQGTRKNDAGQLMRSVAQRLDDADIAAVTGYFASSASTH